MRGKRKRSVSDHHCVVAVVARGGAGEVQWRKGTNGALGADGHENRRTYFSSGHGQ